MAASSLPPLKRQLSDGEQSPIPSKKAKSPVLQHGERHKKDFAQVLAEAKARAAKLRPPTPATKLSNGTGPSLTATSASAISSAERLAQIRARVNKAIGKAAEPEPSISSIVGLQPTAPPTALPKARGGLDIGLHPALLGDRKRDNFASRQTPTSRFQGNNAGQQRRSRKNGLNSTSTDASANPYFEPTPAGKALQARPSRPLVFNEQGKYIAQAAALRRQAALDEMKIRIAQSTRRAGIDEDADIEKNYLVPEPPDIEWWDEGLIDGPNYDAIDDPTRLKIETEDSPITLYIQHPVQIEPPQDKQAAVTKPMYLTAKEQAKLRRQRRMADMKEQQAKIRLGLEPAPAPKVKKSNLMRVLGEEAVKDPTAVEARVNREIEQRLATHLQLNDERKLTKEERQAKAAAQQERDEAKGVQLAAFRIDNLSNGQHRFKVAKNAEQHLLTGVCLITPRMSLVVTEGGSKAIAAFRKLMLGRIDWTGNAPSRVREGANEDALHRWLKAEDEKGDLKDLQLNRCTLVFEGQEKGRAFRKWGTKVCETDAEAREFLRRTGMDSMWTRAKSMEGASAS